MHDTARLAGFFAAHGIWSVSDGVTLVPLLGYEHASGDQGMDRYAGELGAAAQVPYRPRSSPQGFAVHRPKFIKVVGVDQGDYPALADAFFAGVDSHEPAAAVWNAHDDPSI